ncbi:beta-glucosidase [Coprinopsis cinerea okayama7|uniref:beta-glucosidase n=1 Tax=Coprinopsis cinerea (strain Okayama-7 / 130 / ATCC MYA-4618 / FGSC 9003) TaxID=240176 RepID=D6RMY9_COPC7|nr:beta-glucosidase [Coprinopsis cinerea okayama7\|eukprot:XP_002911245.1 beta-glucosidase [Coprinopsis cinerea okayama7\
MPQSIDIDATLLKLSIREKIKLLTGKGYFLTDFPGTHLLLAPTINIHRNPLGGRSSEFYAEDPHLNGFIASAYINGVQSKGVACTIKHFVANDQETERFSISSEVGERALREVYLKPFQIVIKHAKPWALMTAYNRVNGVHVSEDEHLLDDILRKEWGYEGLIMSDWNGVYSTTASIKAGVDIEMPGPTVMRGKAIERALTAEKLFISDIDARVKQILGLYKRAQESGIPFDGPEEYNQDPGVKNILREAAAESIVLLKNDKGILPLTNTVKKIAVIGPNAKVGVPSCGGSARVRSAYTVSPLQGISAAAEKIGAEVGYSLGASAHRYLPTIGPYMSQPGILLEFWNEKPSPDFLSTQPNLGDRLSSPAWTTTAHDTECFLVDGVEESKVNLTCWTRYTCTFIPDEDGDWEFELSIAGVGNLFFGGQLVIDLSTNPPLGGSWFDLGTKEVQTVVSGLKAGTTYQIEIRTSSEDFVDRGPPFPCWGGLRLGAARKIDHQRLVEDAVGLAKDSDVAILVVGLNNDWESEGYDRTDLGLPGNTSELVAAILEANENVVIVNQSGSAVTMPWANSASTILQAFYGGDELGNALADVLFGVVNPSAKLPLTFPLRLGDVPSHGSFGTVVQEPGKVLYNEGIFVGYRGYEVKQVKPLFPFGFGLSYTRFSYTDLSISAIASGGNFDVSLKIKNSGDRDGKEIVQVYISNKASQLAQLVKELKGFVKVYLKAGETKAVKVSLDKEALGYYDSRRRQWVAARGTYEVRVAASSGVDEAALAATIELENEIVWTGL